MLTLCFETDRTKLISVYSALKINGEIAGANFLFLDNDICVGLWRMKIVDKVGCVDKIAFCDCVDNDDRNFFFRAMLFKLQIAENIKLRILGEHNELSQFGFKLVDGNTEINSADINLHNCCKG
ncbi:MAG: hypothetical protein RSB59_02735 [Clostridia bacterium]